MRSDDYRAPLWDAVEVRQGDRGVVVGDKLIDLRLHLLAKTFVCFVFRNLAVNNFDPRDRKRSFTSRLDPDPQGARLMLPGADEVLQ